MNRRCCVFVWILLAVLTPQAGATWSVVIVDTSTGEVAIGSATCLTSFNLKKWLGVVVVGKGAGAAQSAIDQNGKNRKKIFQGLLDGTPPADIIAGLEAGDSFWLSRQYGIADLSPDAAGYTGNGAGKYKEHITGSIGTLTFAIQGNVLTGAPVIEMARLAVVNTQGSVADKLMAAMQAARLVGGDGRCSCKPNNPTGCGSPPLGFDPAVDKSAHVGFMVVSRVGDTDGTCNAFVGCANGSYWMALNVQGQVAADPDPVVQLQQLYDQFRLDSAGHPDGVKSLAAFDEHEVLADGQSTRSLTIALADLNGDAITTGGAVLEITHAPGSAGLAKVLGIVDHGDGTYTVTVRAGKSTGVDRLAVRVNDGTVATTLFPYPELVHREGLIVLQDEVSSSLGGTVSFDLMGRSKAGGRVFALALSDTGTDPGLISPFGTHVPLNPGRLLDSAAFLSLTGVLHGVPGILDVHSRAQVALRLPPDLFNIFAGMTIWAAGFTLQPLNWASNPVAVEIRF